MKFRSPLLAALITAGAFGAGIQDAQAAAVAQSILEITDFTIGTSAAPTSFSFSNTVDASADYNGAPAAAVIAPGSNANAVIGPDAGAYSPGTPYLFSPAQHAYAGGHADIAGGANTGGADSLVDTTVALRDPADGSAQANSGVSLQATFTAVAGLMLTFDMTADAFTRAALDQPQEFAQADMSWQLTIADAAGNVLFMWAPDEINAFATRSLQNTTNDVSYSFSGALTNSFTFDADGTYQLAVRHETNADARWAAEVPEPASLALLGIGVLGLGASIRRRRFTEA